MQLPLQNFSTLVGNAAAAVQGAASQLIDLTVGSVLRAVLEANASLALWLQWLIVLVLQTTRAATSTGPDLDSWMADYTLTRLAAVAAGGQVQFSRFSPTLASLIPAGTQVRTADGTQTFAVTADPTNAAWQPAQNGFALPAGIASITVPVTASTAGAAGNVLAGTITLIAAALPGIDTVTNLAPTAGGADAESDAALRARFQLFLASLARATPVAIGAAVLGTRQGLSYALAENLDSAGNTVAGHFTVTLDDGTGAPTAATISAAAAAIESTRPVGTSYGVLPPVVYAVPVSLNVTPSAGYAHDAVAAAVSAAITAYVDALPIGAALPASRLVQVAYDASPGVANVTGVLVAGQPADYAPGPRGVVKAASVQVG
jgi:uncharacterized phage protein gp47/JayE